MRPAVLATVAALVLAGCGDGAPSVGSDGLVDVTPRALAAVVVDHVGQEHRRTTGGWSDWNDPLQVEAQVDYGVDPEGTESGETATVRVSVADLTAYDERDRLWFGCRPRHESGGCEESETADGRILLYRWSPGYFESEAGGYSWMVVGPDEVVTVAFEGSGLYDSDPRKLDLPVDPDALRKAALDPALSLRTSPSAYAAGEELDSYDGVEERPEKPDIVQTTPRQLASRVVDYIDIEPAEVRPSRLDDLGPDAVGAHLVFPATKRHDAFTLDVLTTVGRVEQIDPLPCPVQEAAAAPRESCFAWDENTAATWTLANGEEPGRVWIIGAQDDDKFNRIETVAVLVTSHALDQKPFSDSFHRVRLPGSLIGDLSNYTADLSVGPEQQVP